MLYNENSTATVQQNLFREDDYMQAVSTTNEVNVQNTQVTPNMIQQHGNVTFDVFLHYSTTSKETLTDKVMRLIRNDIGIGEVS